MEEKPGGISAHLDLDSFSIDQAVVQAGKRPEGASMVPEDEVGRVLQDSPRVEYQDKFVAFVDLLGFRQIVMRTSRHAGRADDNGFRKDTLSKIHSALTSVPEDDYRDLYATRYLNGEILPSAVKLDVVGFSDTLIFWCDPTCEAFGLMVHAVFQTVREFTIRGFYCRGGIKLGELLSDNLEVDGKRRSMPVMFGPAFIQAYDLEQRQAQEARIIFCNESTKAIKRFREEAKIKYPQLDKFFDDYIFQAHDGPFQMDLFADIRRPDPTASDAVKSTAQTISVQLTLIMDEYTESPSVFKKLLALAKTFNTALADGDARIPGLREYTIDLPKSRN
jgi:hypothetical protein